MSWCNPQLDRHQTKLLTDEMFDGNDGKKCFQLISFPFYNSLPSLVPTMLPIPRLLKAQIRGCHATSAKVVVVPVSQVIAILGADVVYDNQIFKWVTTTQENKIVKRSPNSVIPIDAFSEEVGVGGVIRADLLELLIAYKNIHYPDLVITDEKGKIIESVRPRTSSPQQMEAAVPKQSPLDLTPPSPNSGFSRSPFPAPPQPPRSPSPSPSPSPTPDIPPSDPTNPQSPNFDPDISLPVIDDL